jgi:hypothetical protein
MTALFISGGRRFGKSIAELWAYACSAGWSVKRTNGGHLRFSKPGRPVIFTSSTPSDRRGYLNALAMLRRADRQPVVVRHG